MKSRSKPTLTERAESAPGRYYTVLTLLPSADGVWTRFLGADMHLLPKKDLLFLVDIIEEFKTMKKSNNVEFPLNYRKAFLIVKMKNW